MMKKFFPHAYHKEDEDLEKGNEVEKGNEEEQETAIEVWAHHLGIYEHL